MLLPFSCGAQGTITTVAGGAAFIFPKGPLPAIQAPMGRVAAVATDTHGNVYAGDIDNGVVVKITPDGMLTVLAQVASPFSLATDSSGNVFVLDITPGGGVGVLRKVDAGGNLTVITDGGLSRPNGIATDAAGNLYVADSGGNRVRKITPSGAISTVAGSDTNDACTYSGDGGSATSAGFCDPYGVAVDSAGNLYISEAGNSRIRKVNTAGIISTFAGNGNRGYSGDGGAATQAMISWPFGMAAAAGNLYFADSQNHRVRQVTAAGIISTVAGNSTINDTGDGGAGSLATVNTPQAVALDAAGNLYIADTGNSRVRLVTAAGTISTFAGNGAYKTTGDGGAALQASMNSPASVVVDAAGNLLVSDASANRIRKITPGGTISTMAGRGLGFAGDGGPATAALLNMPLQIELDSGGNLYIADSSNGRIRKVDLMGTITTVAGGGTSDPGDGGLATAAVLRAPTGVAVDAAGNLYIAEALGQRIRRVSAGGVISTLASAYFPARLAVDSAGLLYVGIPAMSMARRDGGVTRINADGTQTSVARSFISPYGLAFDSAGTLYVSEGFAGQVMRVGTDLSNTPVAGNGTPGFSGDGGAATSAMLSSPQGLAFDPAGYLYVADSGNGRVRKVSGVECTGAAEPLVKSTLPAGFYIAEIRNPPGTRQGYWGLTVNVNQGVIAGGFNLGGAIEENNGPPGYGAFYVPQAGSVTVQISAQVIPGGDPSKLSMIAQMLDSNRQPVGGSQLGTASIQFTQTLNPGFYILAVRTGAGAPRATFQASIITGSIGGGVNAGGFVADGIVGFGAFYVPVSQDVTLQTFGPSNGPDGASCLQITLLDANRKVIVTAP